MFSKLKSVIITIAAVFAVGVPAVVPAVAYAITSDNAIKCGVNSGVEINLNGDTCTVKGTGSTGGLQGLVVRIINIFSVLVGVIAVIMIIVGGLKYITSGGESGNVSGAKNTIIYAIVGLIVVALAQFIVRFVLQQTNNITQG